MAAKPTAGGSDGTYGTELNEFLDVGHDADGTHTKTQMLTDMGWSPTTQTGANESNGEITLPNGLQMKWGDLAVSGQKDTGWVADFSLTAFTNTCFQVIVCSGKTSGTGGEGIHVYTIDKDGFKLNFENASAVTPVRVFAIGR